MSLWDSVAARFRRGGVARNEAAESAVVRAGGLWDDIVAQAGGLIVPGPRTAMQVSAVYACVNLVAGAISALPMHIYRRSAGGELNRLPDEDLWWVLNEQMAPRWSAATGWEFLVSSLLIEGDAFAEIRRAPDGTIIGLSPIHPSRVTVTATPDEMRLVYAVEPDPSVARGSVGRRVLDQDDMLHVAGFGFDGLRGLSPLRNALRMAGSVALATQEYSARFFANSARPDYVLQSDNPIGADVIDRLRAQLDDRHGSTVNAHRPMVLTNGLKVHTLTLPLAELQFLEIRRFQVEEIARIFGVPAFMIGHTDKTTSWGAGVEAMGKGFVRYALRTHLNKFQNEINRKFFRRASRVAEFDTAELERGDMKSLFESFRIALGRAGEPGFMTTEEVRERLYMPREPDGELNPGGANAAPVEPPAP